MADEDQSGNGKAAREAQANTVLASEYDDEATTAADLKVTPRTLRKWRRQGKGPPYIEVARAFYYPRREREAWLKSLIVRPVRPQRAA
jgi:hypothetical protein